MITKFNCPHCNKPTEVTETKSISPKFSLEHFKCGHGRIIDIVESTKKQGPLLTALLGQTSFPFQDEGINFLENSGFRALLADEMGLGKGHILTDKVLTPEGYKTIGELKLLDTICNSEGWGSTVIGVHDRGVIPAYEVVFTDDSKVTVDGEHLWKVNTPLRKWQKLPFKIKKTIDLMNDINTTSTNSSGNKNSKWFVPTVSPIHFITQQITIDPYILGLLLGDGCFSQNCITFSSKDEEIINSIKEKYEVKHTDTRKYDYRIINSNLKSQLIDLKLIKHLSSSKFIPESYKINHQEVRLKILQGLMDTDGSIWNNGVVEYSTISERLKNDVKFLVESLGGVCKVTTKIPTFKYKNEVKQGQLCYRIVINIPINPFKLSRKANQWKKNEKYPPVRAIKSITPIGDRKIRCIAVDSKDHLYITNNFIVTHNTIQAIGALRFHKDKLLPSIVICKSIAKYNWLKEILNWLNGEVVPQIITTSSETWFEDFPVHIISYDMVRIHTSLEKDDSQTSRTKKVRPDVEKIMNRAKSIIIDECHYIKNDVSQRTVALKQLCKNKPYIIALSGTPIKNNAGEYFPILNILHPEMFNNRASFLRIYCDSFWNGFTWKTGGLANPKDFKEKTKNFILRREMDDVLPDLPPVRRNNSFVVFEGATEKVYDAAWKDFTKYWENYGSKKDFEFYSQVLVKLNVLRHICGIAKVDAATEFAEEFLTDTNRKLTIFVHHQKVSELLEVKLKEMIKILNDDLGMKIGNPLTLRAEDKEKAGEIIENFQKPENRILIASTLAAGESINLQFCSDSLLLERQWNPANEEQAAIGRFRRIGMERPLNMTYLLAAGKIDDYFTELVEQKRQIFNETMRGEESLSAWNEQSIVMELAEILAQKGREKFHL